MQSVIAHVPMSAAHISMTEASTVSLSSFSNRNQPQNSDQSQPSSQQRPPTPPPPLFLPNHVLYQSSIKTSSSAGSMHSHSATSVFAVPPTCGHLSQGNNQPHAPTIPAWNCSSGPPPNQLCKPKILNISAPLPSVVHQKISGLSGSAPAPGSSPKVVHSLTKAALVVSAGARIADSEQKADEVW